LYIVLVLTNIMKRVCFTCALLLKILYYKRYNTLCYNTRRTPLHRAYLFLLSHPLPSLLVKMIYDHMLCIFFFFFLYIISIASLPRSVQSPTLIIIIFFLRDENAFAHKRYNTRVCVSFSPRSDCLPIFEQKSGSSGLRRHSR
jgi:hypothetical protein